jgi:phosphoribosylamine--glycine ligase
MRILVVGSGGREHAIAWRLASEGAEVRVAPGNGGAPSVSIDALDLDGLAEYASREQVALTIVGPEAPLAAGLVEHFAQRGLKAFGPTREAARLEWSKAWTKDFLRHHSIPTGAADTVTSEAALRRTLASIGLPVVLKADGLAGGKGVFILTTREQVDPAVRQLFQLGAAAATVLVEEYLAGPELSVLAFTDGERLAVMPPARDYKRLLDADRGPNTGGMGGYTWPSYATASLLDEIEARVLRPTLNGMQAEGHPYRGVLYAGLILTRDGPKVLEFNCRFGDPECQLILPLLESGLGELCASVVDDALDPQAVHWRAGPTFGVVLAARGYPEAPELGDPIHGLAELSTDVVPFHAGTRRDETGQLVTSGGRVLTVVGRSRDSVYAAADSISFSGKHYRNDVGVEARAAVGAAR